MSKEAEFSLLRTKKKKLRVKVQKLTIPRKLKWGIVNCFDRIMRLQIEEHGNQPIGNNSIKKKKKGQFEREKLTIAN